MKESRGEGRERGERAGDRKRRGGRGEGRGGTREGGGGGGQVHLKEETSSAETATPVPEGVESPRTPPKSTHSVGASEGANLQKQRLASRVAS